MKIRIHFYGIYSLITNIIGKVPSHMVRNLYYRRVCGLSLADDATIYGGLRLRGGKRIRIGSGTSVGDRCELDGRGGLVVGKCVNISSEVMLWTAQHDYRTAGFPTLFDAIVIEDYVWIGPRCIILPGVTVAQGCVVAAGAVVTKSTQPFGIYAGIPAKRIGERPREAAKAYAPGLNRVPYI